MNGRGASSHVTVEGVDPCSGRGRALITAYLEDIVARYYGRRATAAEIELALLDAPSPELAERRGLMLAGRVEGTDLGCVGLRVLDGAIGEVTSLFVAAGMRGQGIGSVLLNALEQAARQRGVETLRLDTRHDLIEARRLYVQHGFQEVPAFNTEQYADHWFAKTLRSS